MKIEAKGDGFKNLHNTLQGMADKLESSLKVGVKAGVEIIQTSAKNKVVVKSGNLKSNIQTKVEVISQGKVKGVCYVDAAGAPYGIFIEKGTGIYAVNGDGRKTRWSYKSVTGWVSTIGTRAQPFMAPAFEQEKHNAVDTAKRIVIEGIKS